jgi:hypothetical protein
MKKTLLTTISTVVLSMAVQAQVTYDFESWTTQAGPPSYIEPQGWGTFNILSTTIAGNDPLSVFRDTVAPHGGQASMRVESVDLIANVFSILPDTISAAFIGSLDLSGIHFGQPFAGGRPQFFNWFGKYTPANGTDLAFVTCALTKWNGSSADTIASVMHILTSGVSNWQGFNDLFIYNQAFNNLIPDSIIIFCSSTDQNLPIPGGKLWIDDITFSGYVGLSESAALVNEVRVFPNPSSEFTNFRFNTDAAQKVLVYDITGREIGIYRVLNREAKIETYALACGVYSYAVLDEDDQVINRGKFNVAK